MSDPVLDIRDLTVALPPGAERPHAIEGVSLALARNEILCVVGESGSGKSLTALAVMGLLPTGVRVSSGSIGFDGRDLATLDDAAMRRIRGARIGMIFQEPMTALNPVMRVGDQIGELLRFHGAASGDAGARIEALLASVGLPEPASLRHAYPFRLSGGQRQRVMIAMALALDPAILIADEPTTALDVTTQAQILSLIRSIQATRGMGVLFITHDFGVVAEIATRVAVMRHGRLVELGTAAEVLQRPQHDYTRALLAAVPRLAPKRRAPIESEITLDVTRLSKTFRGGGGWFRPKRVTRAVHEVSLAVRAGETLGVVGESGSGKSTLARLVVRLVQADGGEVRIRGIDGNFLALPAAALRQCRRRVQMIFQDPYASLNPRRRVGDIIAQGPLAHGEDAGVVAKRVTELLQLVRLDPGAAERFPHEFSGGQRQRIGIARALALEPDLLIADEPVSALDVSVQAQVLELLDELQRRLRFAMVFITHDLRVAAQVCDRVAVMRQGAVVELGPTSQVLASPRHDYTRQLLASVPGRAGLAAAYSADQGSRP